MRANSSNPLVGIVVGSESDVPVMKAAVEVLEQFGIPYEFTIASAHRAPARVQEYAKGAAGRGLEVIIAGAGMAAHLPGVIASWTVLPVIGVPIKGGALGGVDALYSIVQMPGGIPVATVAIDGAKNAALLACEILGVKFPEIRDRLMKYRQELESQVASAAARVAQIHE
ncbi:MAG TPA: 5-(carboxyamino)imidazole ribonucleotide mutase [Firmicutes bacterium]|nr:5-(carboxyamino)imidazole ribonucleotide mutase [Bacillota bacterium]